MKYSQGSYSVSFSGTTSVVTSVVLQGTRAGVAATLKVWGE
jgi:hypothetical protein